MSLKYVSKLAEYYQGEKWNVGLDERCEFVTNSAIKTVTITILKCQTQKFGFGGFLFSTHFLFLFSLIQIATL